MPNTLPNNTYLYRCPNCRVAYSFDVIHNEQDRFVCTQDTCRETTHYLELVTIIPTWTQTVR